ncbi:MAG TPA: hypothetical protein VFW71_14635 [Actinomycetota bacterium]|nr:hypothetical protein [Actinomycetota bacterium]
MRNGTAPSPLRTVVDGAAAGLMGTIAMDAVRYAEARRSGSTGSFKDFELARAVRGWDSAPAPGQFGRRLIEGLRQKPLDASKAQPTTAAVHVATGALWGALFGLVAGSLDRGRWAWAVLYGPLVWGANYGVLSALGLYRGVTEEEPSSVAKDIGVHLVYGLSGALAYRLVHRRARSRPTG